MDARPLAQEVFNTAFGKPRNARSDEYKLGVLNCLKVRLDGARNVTCPYPEGSAQADAYYAGVDEGRSLAPVDQAPAGFDDADDETPLSLRL